MSGLQMIRDMATKETRELRTTDLGGGGGGGGGPVTVSNPVLSGATVPVTGSVTANIASGAVVGVGEQSVFAELPPVAVSFPTASTTTRICYADGSRKEFDLLNYFLVPLYVGFGNVGPGSATPVTDAPGSHIAYVPPATANGPGMATVTGVKTGGTRAAAEEWWGYAAGVTGSVGFVGKV